MGKFGRRVIICTAILIILIGIVFVVIESSTRNRATIDDFNDAIANKIEAGLKGYLVLSNDSRFQNIHVISGKTKSLELISNMKKTIPDKENPTQTYSAIFSDSVDYLPKSPYVGFKIDIYIKENKVIVNPQKKESECIVTIVE